MISIVANDKKTNIYQTNPLMKTLLDRPPYLEFIKVNICFRIS